MRIILCAIMVLAVCMLPALDSVSLEVAGYEVDVTGKVMTKWDDNLLYNKDNSKKDIITDVNIGINAEHEAKDWALSFGGSLNQEVYGKNSKYNNLSEDLSLAASVDPTKYDRITVNDTFQHTDTPRKLEEESVNDRGGTNIILMISI